MNKTYKIAITITIIITIIVLYLTTPTAATEYTFKKTNWGMTQIQVINSETLTLIDKHADFLIYKTETGAGLYYFFTDDKLESVLYHLGPLNYNDEKVNNYLELFVGYYEGYKDVLVNKYGTPIEQSDRIINKEGFLGYGAAWKTHNTAIAITVTGDENDLTLKIIHEDKTTL